MTPGSLSEFLEQQKGPGNASRKSLTRLIYYQLRRQFTECAANDPYAALRRRTTHASAHPPMPNRTALEGSGTATRKPRISPPVKELECTFQ